ncbi:MAG: CRISPR-associated helicase Cas3' [Theionarchaea archaeon]|nr:CRISPR-associated helicase Cas3' [Theionarchaea archaeon]
MQGVAKSCETEFQGEKKTYFQTLEGHTTDCLRILKCYFEKNYQSVLSFSKRCGTEPATLMKNLFVTIYLHDVGKLTRQFQDRIRQNKRSQRYPHAFFGFPLALEVFKVRIPSVYPIEGFPVVEPLTVLSHHSQLHDALYQNAEIRRVDPLQEEMVDHLNHFPKAYDVLGFKPFFEFAWDLNAPVRSIEVLKSENARRKINSYLFPLSRRSSVKGKVQTIEELSEMTRMKSLFTFFLSVTKLCDFYSSAHFSDFCAGLPSQKVLGPLLESPDDYVLTLPTLSAADILGNNVPYGFQSRIRGEASPYSFLFAPCGRGKTEAALIWALDICRRFNKNKIVFAMPTQTTSNAILDRFVKTLNKAGFHGKELVGLYHGKSSIKLKEELRREKGNESELDEEEVEEVKSEEFKGKVFYKPVTVTTIDHLILSFVHGFPQADFACGNLQNAVMVFDEIHYYEAQTLRHLVDLFTILRKMRIPHLLMSGTLPAFMTTRLARDSIEEGITYKEVQDDEGLSFTPFKMKFLDYHLVEKGTVAQEVVEEVRSNYLQNLNQFIILNTVRRAQQFYDAIKSEIDKGSLCLIHSQFTYSDRTKKEKELIEGLKKGKRPVVVVSTQVIEISLDISCDVMYTEVAPSDALGQRAGRLNRNGTHWKTDGHEFLMKVYPPEHVLPYEESIVERTRDSLHEGVHSYGSLKDVCDSVYGDDYLEEFEKRGKFEGAYGFLEFEGKPSLFKKCFLFGLKPGDITFSEEVGNHFVIRTGAYRKFDVVPEVRYEDNEGKLRTENQVKIPYWWIQLDMKMHGDELQWFEPVERQFKWKTRIYWICKLPYHEEYGFDSSILEEENERIGLLENVL